MLKIRFDFNVKVYVNDELLQEKEFSLGEKKEEQKTEEYSNSSDFDSDQIIQYGKNKGMKYMDLDVEYLEWIVENSSVPQEEKEKCKKFIKMKKESKPYVIELDNIAF